MRRIAMIGSAAAAAALLTACGSQDDAAETEAAAEMEAATPDAAEPDAMDQADAGPDIEIDPDASPAERNLAMGEAFLAQNAGRDGVTETASGLQYEVLEAAEDGAESPTLQNWVCVHYTGSLIDGTVFDSSRNGPAPIVLPLNGLIRGWQEALPMMAEGDRWNLFIPSNLGYGPNGAGNVIPPNAALVFDLKLFRVLAAEDIAVGPNGRPDPSWDCSQTAPLVEDE